MKVKDVLERTGLTDRAVRLYIANGLVAPECSRSYTGRNNYEFSEADVEVLKRIALLRKADFSIEQIKALQSGGWMKRRKKRRWKFCLSWPSSPWRRQF